MTRVERYNEQHFGQLVDLFKEHNSIARQTLVDYSYDNLYPGLLNPKIVTYCHFVDDEMTSFMISNMLDELPTWLVRLVCGKKTNFFNPKRIGICSLYDTTISHWESQGITNFFYIQPAIFLSSGNEMTRKGSPKLQEYEPYDYLTIKANTESEYSIIKKIMAGKIFEEDMCARWCFKK